MAGRGPGDGHLRRPRRATSTIVAGGRVTPFRTGCATTCQPAPPDRAADIHDKLELTDETAAKLKDACAAYHDSFAADAGASEVAAMAAEAEALEEKVESAEAEA